MTADSNSPAGNGVPPANLLPPVPTPPPVLPPPPAASSGRSFLSTLLSVCLGLFLLDAIISLADDSLILLFNHHGFSAPRAVISFFTGLVIFVVYVLLGITPLVPKRFFLPVTLFMPVALLALIPLTIYFFSHAPWLNWCVSLLQVIIALAILSAVQGGLKWRWPLVPETWLRGRSFSWLNLGGFFLFNVVLVPVILIFYLFFCAALAMDHFTGGFLTLHPKGLVAQASKYVRADGKTIQLYPMAHVADADFYENISASFPTNSLILMEGVTDDQHLLTNHISYKKMAQSLGLKEQKEEFKPTRGKVVSADIDVDQFTATTIRLLNEVMLIHAEGPNAQNLQELLQHPMTTETETTLFDDLLGKRNQHLLEQIRLRLAQTDYIIVPWGAAHMPTISAEIQKAGFHLVETKKYTVVRFDSGKKSE